MSIEDKKKRYESDIQSLRSKRTAIGGAKSKTATGGKYKSEALYSKSRSKSRTLKPTTVTSKTEKPTIWRGPYTGGPAKPTKIGAYTGGRRKKEY